MSQSLKIVAKQTVDILEKGGYMADSGDFVDLQSELQAAIDGTCLYRPEQLQALSSAENACEGADLAIEMTDERTRTATHRLVQIEGRDDVALLNYASARNPGGGFASGAQAQEEDLVRASGLYPCLRTQPAYYGANRHQRSLLYTDHIIYSPKVPFFRLETRDLMESPFLASVITAPAPNAGQVLRRDPNASAVIEETLRRRAGMVLAVARDKGHRTLVLGGWGCGVFRNDPAVMAEIWESWLDSPEFVGCFDRVVFGVYDRRRNKAVFHAFAARFGGDSQR